MSGAELGCDLEIIEPRSDAFVADYFTTEEQALIARASAADRPRLLALLWSAKESALKALHEGLRLDTRCVIVSPFDESFDLNGWSPLRVRYTGGVDLPRLVAKCRQHRANRGRLSRAGFRRFSLAIPAHFFDSASRCA